MINLTDIINSKKIVDPYINNTPMIFSNSLSNKNRNVYLKLESLQVTGSFKIRGALNKLLNLSEDHKKKGIVAVSTGNHGKAVAHASKILQIKSIIFMSKMVPNYRKEAIEELGAQVKIEGNNSDESDEIATKYSKQHNMALIHPFDDEDIISGQGTIGLEMLSTIPNVDTVIIPTSGGGLIGGISIAIKQQNPNVKIIGVSMKKGPSMYNSLKEGRPVDVVEEETLADCLGGGIGLNNKYTFDIAKKHIDDFVLIDEDKIAEGIKYNYEKHKIVTEGAAATSVMAVHENSSTLLGKNIICLICGGNIENKLFKSLIG